MPSSTKRKSIKFHWRHISSVSKIAPEFPLRNSCVDQWIFKLGSFVHLVKEEVHHARVVVYKLWYDILCGWIYDNFSYCSLWSILWWILHYYLHFIMIGVPPLYSICSIMMVAPASCFAAITCAFYLQGHGWNTGFPSYPYICKCSQTSTCRTDRCPCSKLNMLCKEGCECPKENCRNKETPIGGVLGNDEVNSLWFRLMSDSPCVILSS